MTNNNICIETVGVREGKEIRHHYNMEERKIFK